MAEAFANIGAASLNNGATLNATDTTITVTSEVNVPATGTFRALIQNELLKVTNVTGHVWTVVRGDDGTTAATHADATNINIVITKASLDALVSIQSGGTEITNRRVLNLVGANVADNAGQSRSDITILGSNYNTGANKPAAGFTGRLYIPSDGVITQVDSGSAYLGYSANGLFTIPPTVSNWSWANQGTATATDIPGGGIYLLTTTHVGDDNKLLLRTLSPPYTITCGFKAMIADINNSRTGIYLYDTVSTKVEMFGLGEARNYRVSTWATPTSSGSNVTGLVFCNLPDIIWLRIFDNSTTRKFLISVDGVNWIQIYSEATNTFLTPNRVGIGVDTNNATFPGFMTLVSWKEA